MTLPALRKHLSSQAWAPLSDPNSALSKTLLSSAFKKKGTDGGINGDASAADQIDVESLKSWALLHCTGKPVDKAHAFFCVLQDGGFEKHE